MSEEESQPIEQVENASTSSLELIRRTNFLLSESKSHHRNLALQLQKVMTDALNETASNSGSRRKTVVFDVYSSNQAIGRRSVSQSRSTRRMSSHFPSLPEFDMQDSVSKGEIVEDPPIRDLPVSISEKRRYRQSLAFDLKRRPWHKKFKEKAEHFYKRYSPKCELWNEHLKIIEGLHGAGVVSYFLFIRWLLYMNLIIFSVNFMLLILPRILFAQENQEHHLTTNRQDLRFNNAVQNVLNKSLNSVIRSLAFPENIDENSILVVFNETTNITLKELTVFCHKKYVKSVNKIPHIGVLSHIQNLVQGTGPLETTPLFIGSYSDDVFSYYFGLKYYAPVAFILTQIITVVVCATMMAQFYSIGLTEVTKKEIENYANAVFCGWDCCIESERSALLHRDRFFLNMQICINEERRKEEVKLWSDTMRAKLYAIRTLINVIVALWILACFLFIYNVALYQIREQKKWWLYKRSRFRALIIQFLSPAALIAINTVSPIIMSILVTFEKYHAETEINISILRNAFLWLSSVVVLVKTIHTQISCEPRDACGKGLNDDCMSPRCWETFVGQQLYKLTISDFFVYIGIFLCYDIVRDVLVTKFDNRFTRAYGRQEFYLPTEVLYPVYSQTISWLGVFYAPVIPGIMVIKIICIFYIRKTMLFKFSQPSTILYRASRFNFMFVVILMLSFFAVTTIHFFALEIIPTSRGCSPFRQAELMVDAIANWYRVLLFWRYFNQPWIFAPACMMLCIAMYYYYNVILSNKELSKRLRGQIILANKDKHFLLERIEKLAKAEAASKENNAKDKENNAENKEKLE